jgi:sulfotransferase family protein/uncharacterized protein DUF354
MPPLEVGGEGPRQVWIDLSNSPHALLFAPVASELGRRGHQVLVTARDNAQTAELARQHWPDVEVIGAESPPGRARKVGTLLNRVAGLRRWAKQREPDVALSHNSYAQVVAARSLGIPCVTAMDFEHQPANHLAFRLADSVLVPEAIPAKAIRRQGARDSKLHRYPGLKESIYLGNFAPDPDIVAKLGVEREADEALVVLRTPPSRAIYHRFANPLFGHHAPVCDPRLAPRDAVPNESHFILPFARRRAKYEKADAFAVDRFLEDIRDHPSFREMGVVEDDLRSDLTASPPHDYAEAVRRVFAVYARSEGKTRYADKTPSYVLSLPALARLFPEARFIHIIRDGRDVALSYLDVPWGPSSLPEAALLWKRAVTRGRRAGSRLGQTRYHEIRYEELIDDPAATVATLCEFLELDFVPEMLQYFGRADQVAGRMPFQETRQALYLPPTKGLRDWRTQMAGADVAQFEALAGNLLTELGYERGAVEIPFSERLRAARSSWAVRARRTRVRAGRLGRRLSARLRYRKSR